ncbi:MAG: hypothetical protein EBU57_04455 [Alphaproteobacteria bacterium]|nr:hypothetical protein [Alphaproteobacteria bacterium]
MSDEFPDNAWYAVGGSDALASGDVIPVHLFGEERVAWRGTETASPAVITAGGSGATRGVRSSRHIPT